MVIAVVLLLLLAVVALLMWLLMPLLLSLTSLLLLLLSVLSSLDISYGTRKGSASVAVSGPPVAVWWLGGGVILQAPEVVGDASSDRTWDAERAASDRMAIAVGPGGSIRPRHLRHGHPLHHRVPVPRLLQVRLLLDEDGVHGPCDPLGLPEARGLALVDGVDGEAGDHRVGADLQDLGLERQDDVAHHADEAAREGAGHPAVRPVGQRLPVAAQGERHEGRHRVIDEDEPAAEEEPEHAPGRVAEQRGVEGPDPLRAPNEGGTGLGTGLCLVILGGGGPIGPPGFWLTHPPTHPPTHPHQKIFPQEKNEIYQTGPNLEVDFTYTNFFLAFDPPPPRYSINQPLSKGLAGDAEGPRGDGAQGVHRGHGRGRRGGRREPTAGTRGARSGHGGGEAAFSGNIAGAHTHRAQGPQGQACAGREGAGNPPPLCSHVQPCQPPLSASSSPPPDLFPPEIASQPLFQPPVTALATAFATQAQPCTAGGAGHLKLRGHAGGP